MGTCLSKKSVCATSSLVAVPNPPEKPKSEAQLEQSVVKKEIFIIKHRTSHEIERQRPDEEKGGATNKADESVADDEIGSSGDAVSKGNNNSNGVIGGGAPLRTSSCTKEEVDAILIQCGRLSRSSSAALQPESGGRKYSGSKRSYDFDNETGKSDGNNGDDERENRRRERHRNSPGRRRTPSRERERDQARPGSRERTGNVGRRVSRSPGRRSDSPITTKSNSDPSPHPNSKPSKMISVPATVPPSLDANASVKRIQVKRNATSPRTRSPARTRAANENPQPISLSRSNSRKAENSPYRRNPLSEIDTNIISQVPTQKPNAENKTNCTKPENNTNCRKSPIEEVNGQTFAISENVAMNVIPQESPKPQTLTRSRSSRLSRDLDNVINPDNVSSSSSSYTALLLEDIQNFHQKNTTNNPPAAAAFKLPECVTKARSILEAVADLNSTEQINKMGDSNKASKIRHHPPILESEVVGKEDDLMEPSFHKYVTVRRGTDDLEEQQESSGSNSLQQQQWVSSSCWEPNSAESTDRWTCSSSSSSSRAVSKQSAAVPDSGTDGGKKVTAKKRDFSDHQNGIGRGRIGTRGTHAAAVSLS